MFYPKSKRSERWNAVRNAMAEWRNSHAEPTTWNNSLRGRIEVSNRLSLKETPYWASKTEQSTRLVCDHFNEILRYAVRKEEVTPHESRRSVFSKLIILERVISATLTAKMTVGVRLDGSMVQYCITASA